MRIEFMSTTNIFLKLNNLMVFSGDLKEKNMFTCQFTHVFRIQIQVGFYLSSIQFSVNLATACTTR